MAINAYIITLKAPLQKDWDILTRPEFFKQWQYGSELITEAE